MLPAGTGSRALARQCARPRLVAEIKRDVSPLLWPSRVVDYAVGNPGAVTLAPGVRSACVVPPRTSSVRAASKPGATVTVAPRLYEALSLRLFPGARRPQGVGDEELHKYSSRRVQYPHLAGLDITGTLPHVVAVVSPRGFRGNT